jgi:MFS family permease
VRPELIAKGAPISSFQRIRDPYAALRYPAYRSYVCGTFLFTVAFFIQEVSLGYELYVITRDPLALGLIGLATFVPFIGLSLFGGHLADRMSRRLIIMVSVGVITLGSVFLHLSARRAEQGDIPAATLVPVIYATVFMIGVCRAFQSPAAASLRAFLVPIAVYENAATWSSSSFQAGAILGPAVAGFLFSWLGFSGTLLVVISLFLLALFFYAQTGNSRVMAGQPGRSLLASVREGVSFVWGTKVILYSLSLDLFSVLFGGVVALLPIYAQDILNVGARGLGILRAAPSAGAVLMLMVLQRVSPMRHAWRTLLSAVAGFGASIIVFALSPWMALSVAALFVSGACDSISIVIRQTLLQLRTPDEMRGRVMSVNGIFVSSSNELGAFESGTTARLMGVVPSAVFGGVMTLLVVGWVTLRARELFNVRFDERGTDG